MDGRVINPPSSPSSSSNASSSPGSALRNDGLLPYGSSAVSSMLKLPNDNELRCEGVDRLIQRLRTCDAEYKKLLMERGRVMKDVNRRLQAHLVEVRGLKETNQKLQQEIDRLSGEKEELGGMCCFLDDDREKAKKMAHEWQIFGRYATGVLQKELSQCRTKMQNLEKQQNNLLAENKNLKEICLLLDEQKAGSRTSLDSQGSFPGPMPGLLGVAGTRDSGDGSSNGSTASNYSPDHKSSMTSNSSTKEGSTENRESYIRYLENKVKHLEDEMKGRTRKVPVTVSAPPNNHMSPGKSDRRMFPPNMHHPSNSSPSTGFPVSNSFSMNGSIGNSLTAPNTRIPGGDASMSISHQLPGQTETMAYAMKVLEMHNQLDNSVPNSMYPGVHHDSSHLDEQHKEIVREMCNVVWRKLGDSRGNMNKAPPPRVLQHRSASVSNL